MAHKGIVLKIKDIYINRSYGFNDGGTIIIGHFYKNGRPVQDADDIIFSERNTIVERYATACGIKREDQLEKLIGLQVAVEYDFEGNYEYEYLTRPFKISEKLKLPKYDYIISNFVAEVMDDEEVVA